jgi:hypothetical protein
MNPPESNPTTQSGAVALELVQSSTSETTPAPVVSTLALSTAERIIGHFAAENCRQAADAIEAGQLPIAKMHIGKASRQISELEQINEPTRKN